jgi:hypothetical protein
MVKILVVLAATHEPHFKHGFMTECGAIDLSRIPMIRRVY